MRFRLELIRTITGPGHDLRTNPTFGNISRYPQLGRSFWFLADPIIEGTARAVITSTVKYIVGDLDMVTFVTRNSMYRLTRLKNDEPGRTQT